MNYFKPGDQVRFALFGTVEYPRGSWVEEILSFPFLTVTEVYGSTLDVKEVPYSIHHSWVVPYGEVLCRL